MTAATPTTCTDCGGRLGVLWSTDDAGNRVCRRCFYERLEPTPEQTPAATTRTPDFQDSGVCVAPPTSEVSADVCGTSNALSSYEKPSASASALSTSPETADEKAENQPDEDEELGWVDRLLVEYHQGLLEPLWTPLPPLPDNVSPLARRVAADYQLVLSCRRGAGKHDPVLYAVRWVARRVGAGRAGVSGALVSLRETGVLELRDPPPKWKNYGGGRRAHFYLPAGFDPCAQVPLEAGAIPVEAQAVRQPPPQPVAEDDDVQPVPVAQLRWDAHRPAVDDSPGVLAAPGHSADSRHDAKPSRDDGWDLDYLASLEPEPER